MIKKSTRRVFFLSDVGINLVPPTRSLPSPDTDCNHHGFASEWQDDFTMKPPAQCQPIPPEIECTNLTNESSLFDANYGQKGKEQCPPVIAKVWIREMHPRLFPHGSQLSMLSNHHRTTKIHFLAQKP